MLDLLFLLTGKPTKGNGKKYNTKNISGRLTPTLPPEFQ